MPKIRLSLRDLNSKIFQVDLELEITDENHLDGMMRIHWQ